MFNKDEVKHVRNYFVGFFAPEHPRFNGDMKAWVIFSMSLLHNQESIIEFVDVCNKKGYRGKNVFECIGSIFNFEIPYWMRCPSLS